MWMKMTAGAGLMDGSYQVAASVKPSSVRTLTRWDAAPAVSP